MRFGVWSGNNGSILMPRLIIPVQGGMA